MATRRQSQLQKERGGNAPPAAAAPSALLLVPNSAPAAQLDQLEPLPHQSPMPDPDVENISTIRAEDMPANVLPNEPNPTPATVNRVFIQPKILHPQPTETPGTMEESAPNQDINFGEEFLRDQRNYRPDPSAQITSLLVNLGSKFDTLASAQQQDKQDILLQLRQTENRMFNYVNSQTAEIRNTMKIQPQHNYSPSALRNNRFESSVAARNIFDRTPHSPNRDHARTSPPMVPDQLPSRPGVHHDRSLYQDNDDDDDLRPLRHYGRSSMSHNSRSTTPGALNHAQIVKHLRSSGLKEFSGEKGSVSLDEDSAGAWMNDYKDKVNTIQSDLNDRDKIAICSHFLAGDAKNWYKTHIQGSIQRMYFDNHGNDTDGDNDYEDSGRGDVRSLLGNSIVSAEDDSTFVGKFLRQFQPVLNKDMYIDKIKEQLKLKPRRAPAIADFLSVTQKNSSNQMTPETMWDIFEAVVERDMLESVARQHKTGYTKAKKDKDIAWLAKRIDEEKQVLNLLPQSSTIAVKKSVTFAGTAPFVAMLDHSDNDAANDSYEHNTTNDNAIIAPLNAPPGRPYYGGGNNFNNASTGGGGGRMTALEKEVQEIKQLLQKSMHQNQAYHMNHEQVLRSHLYHTPSPGFNVRTSNLENRAYQIDPQFGSYNNPVPLSTTLPQQQLANPAQLRQYVDSTTQRGQVHVDREPVRTPNQFTERVFATPSPAMPATAPSSSPRMPALEYNQVLTPGTAPSTPPRRPQFGTPGHGYTTTPPSNSPPSFSNAYTPAAGTTRDFNNRAPSPAAKVAVPQPSAPFPGQSMAQQQSHLAANDSRRVPYAAPPPREPANHAYGTRGASRTDYSRFNRQGSGVNAINEHPCSEKDYVDGYDAGYIAAVNQQQAYEEHVDPFVAAVGNVTETFVSNGYPPRDSGSDSNIETDKLFKHDDDDPGGNNSHNPSNNQNHNVDNAVHHSHTMVLHKNPAFTLKATLAHSKFTDRNTQVTSLIDTGAEFNVISLSVLKSIFTNYEQLMSPLSNNLKCIDASGNNMKILGVLNVDLILTLTSSKLQELVPFTLNAKLKQSDEYFTTIIVETLPYPVILGLPFLEQHDCAIFPASRTVRAKNHSFVSNRQYRQLSAKDRKRYEFNRGSISMIQNNFDGINLLLQSNVSLPPLGFAFIPLCYPEYFKPYSLSHDERLVFMPNEVIQSISGIEFIAGIIDMEKPCVVAVNTNMHPVELQTNDLVGSCAVYYSRPSGIHIVRSTVDINTAVTSIAMPIASTNVNQSLYAPTAVNHKSHNSANGETVMPKLSECIPAPLKPQYQSLIDKYADVFVNDFSSHSWKAEPAKIELMPGTKPYHATPFRLPEAHYLALKKLIEEFLREKIIAKSNSPWAAPCFFVPKPNGKLRLVIDYRVLNSNTVKYHWPLPHIEDLLHQLRGAKVFSTFDAHTGFHQLPMDKDSQYLTSFVTPFGQYMYLRLPMGLANAPSIFSKAMDDFAKGLENLLIFVDDINVYSGAEVSNPSDSTALYSSHYTFLEKFFEKCESDHLKLNGAKSTIGNQRVEYLGHVISNEGIYPSPKKVQAVQSFKVPRNVTEVKQFLGIVNYYRAWIKDCAKLQLPLNALTMKNTLFDWTEECQRSFDTLKKALTTDCVRHFPSNDSVFHLDCDASDFAIGSVLSQKDPNNKDDPGKVLGYHSRSLTAAERNYTMHEKELLAIIDSLQHFRIYLATQSNFYVHTDHKSLVTILKWKTPSRRIARWLVLLSEYNFATIYKPGHSNANADALSRYPSAEVDPSIANIDRIVFRDGMWKAEEAYDRGNSKYTEIKATISPLLTELGGFDEDISVANTNRRKLIDATTKEELLEVLKNEKYFSLYGLYYDNLNTGKRYIIRDVYYDALHQRHMVLQSPTLDNGNVDNLDEDEEVTLDSILPHLVGIPFYNYHKDTYGYFFDESFRNAVAEEIPSLIRNKSLREEDIRILPTEENEYHYYRRFFDDRTKTEHLQLIIPSSDQITKAQLLKNALLRDYHENQGHFGVEKIYHILRQRVFWKNMKEDIAAYVQSCEQCNAKKNVSQPNIVKRHPLVIRPFQRVSCDLLGPFPETPNTKYLYIVSLVDHFTKWTITAPICNKTAGNVADVIIHKLFLVYGPAQVLLADNGSEITANNVNAFIFSRLGFYLTNTTGYHPASNGQVERLNRTLKDYIAKVTTDSQHKDWDRYLTAITHAHNTSVSPTTGYTPYFLLFGRECPRASDTLFPNIRNEDIPKLRKDQVQYVNHLIKQLRLAQALATENIDVSQSLYNKPTVVHRVLHHIHEPVYEVGQEVLLYTPAVKKENVKKFSKFWHGPYLIAGRIGDVTYLVNMRNGKPPQPVHYSRLKPYYQRAVRYATAVRPLLL